MDLKDFVAASLTQIAEGVAQAAPAISALGGAASPAFTAANTAGEYLGHTRDGSKTAVYAVAFDVAVVVGKAGTAEGGGNLQVASFLSIGAKAGKASTEETTSRLKFVVPLQLPTDIESEAAAKAAADKREREFKKSLPPGSGSSWMA